MSNFFILNYHSILPHWGFDVACQTLDMQFRILKTFCSVVPLDEICNLAVNGITPKRTTVAVTFDDGYADTFAYAVPLCKKHRIPATIFPIASRIIEDDLVRPTLDDYWRGKTSYRDLHKTVPWDICNLEYLESGNSSAFMTTAELRNAANSVTIGSHALLHQLVFCENKVIDIFDGTTSYSRLFYAYNGKPVKGYPVFPDQSSLCANRGNLRDDVKEHIKNIDSRYFQQPNWKELLRNDLMRTFTDFLSFESEEERSRRIEAEITKSKQKLEIILGKSVRYFAYPYGQHDPVSERIVARQFDAAFTTDIDIIRRRNTIHLLPRAKVHRDISSFFSRIIKFSLKK